MKTEKKSIKCILSDEEKRQYHTDLLNALATADQVNGELDQVKASYKAKIAEAECRITSLRATLGAGFEYRPIMCSVVLDAKTGKKTFVRNDTGEVGAIEDMSKDDFQTTLSDVENSFE